MSLEIVKEGIQPPAQNNLTWIFPVRLNGGESVPWKVDSFDLGIWFKEVVGRYPSYERGDRGERDDILSNWDTFEPRLRQEAEKQAQLTMKIVVRGERTSPDDWNWAQITPEAELPPLNDLQREAARKLGVPEELYRRRYAAGQRSLSTLLERTERVGRYLHRKLKQSRPDGEIKEITFETEDGKFILKIGIQGEPMVVRVDEAVIDEVFDAGSPDAERRIERIFEIAQLTRATQ